MRHIIKTYRIIDFGDSQTLHEISLLESVYEHCENNDYHVVNPFDSVLMMIMRSGTGVSLRDKIHVVFVNEDLGI